MKINETERNLLGKWEITHACGHKGWFYGKRLRAIGYAEEECPMCYKKRMEALVKELGLPELKGSAEEIADAEYVRYVELEYDCVKEAVEKLIYGSEQEWKEIWQKASEFDAKENHVAAFYAVALCTEESAEWWIENWR